MNNRKIRTPEEKFKIVIAGIKGDYGTVAELCNHFGITQTDFYRWRDILSDNGARLFAHGGVDKETERLQKENCKLKQAVGELTMELKKTTGSTTQSRTQKTADRMCAEFRVT